MNAKGLKVWTLIYYSLDNNEADEFDKIQTIPCSSLDDLEEHVRNLMFKNIDMFDLPYRPAILYSIGVKNMTKLMATFRSAHTHNSKKIKFDLFWDDRPGVVL